MAIADAQFEVEQFNDAARVVYDQAYQRGARDGREAAVAERGKQQAVGSLEVAQQIARLARDLEEAGSHDDAQRAADLTRMLLGRTPYLASSEAIAAIDEYAGRSGARARGRSDIIVLGDVIGHVDEDLERVKRL